MKYSHTSSHVVGELLPPLEISDLTVDGNSLARHEGRVVFLNGGLPGAVVSARISRLGKNVLFADIVDTRQASPFETQPWCPHANECGGCSWQHLSPAAALAWKSAQVRQNLARIGKIQEPEVMEAIASPLARGFRNKMSFAFGSGPEKRCLLGLRRRNEHSLVEVEQCGLMPAPAMDIVRYVRESVNRLGLAAWGDGQGYLRHLVLRIPGYAPQGRQQILAECISGPAHQGRAGGERSSNAEKLRLLGQELMERFALTAFIHSERRHSAEVAQGERKVLTLGEACFEERIGHLSLKAPYNAFMQTNTEAAALLYEEVARAAALNGSERVWDLYCGVGGIGLYLAEKAGELRGFEISPESVAMARANSEALGFTHCSFQECDLQRGLLPDAPGPDLLIMDPPRSGISKALAASLLSVPASKLIYVSCDPATQARDLALLSPAWRLERSQPVDMFPYTPRIENLIVLTNRAS